MKLLEYEAKNILKSYTVPVPDGQVTTGAIDDITLPSVIKSQVPVGGRGKAGGIKVVTDRQSLERAVSDVLDLEIKGHKPQSVLCEELIDIDRELYLSLAVDRPSSSIVLMAHADGGIEVESHDSTEFFRQTITTGTVDAIGQMLADFYELPEKSFILTDLVENLLKCTVGSDALLVEINPLILTKSGALIAGDCKMTLDNAAAFRHKDWDFEDKPQNANFITLNEAGTVATIANGAGLAMATVDAVKAAGFVPANFLDIGGNATTEGILESFNQIVKFSQVNHIIINIFGGIVRCDTVANAIIEAKSAIPSLPTLLVRLSGTNADLARELLEAHGMTLYDTLEDCLEELPR
jgi:succinyl-CoA synthetase beta subunit